MPTKSNSLRTRGCKVFELANKKSGHRQVDCTNHQENEGVEWVRQATGSSAILYQ